MNSHYILVTIPSYQKGEHATTHWVIPKTVPDNAINTTVLSDLNYNFNDMKMIEEYFLRVHSPPASKIEILSKQPPRAYLRNRLTIKPNELETKLLEYTTRKR